MEALIFWWSIGIRVFLFLMTQGFVVFMIGFKKVFCEYYDSKNNSLNINMLTCPGPQNARTRHFEISNILWVNVYTQILFQTNSNYPPYLLDLPIHQIVQG